MDLATPLYSPTFMRTHCPPDPILPPDDTDRIIYLLFKLSVPPDGAGCLSRVFGRQEILGSPWISWASSRVFGC